MSLAEPDQIRAAARRVAQLRASGFDVVTVVSAMGKTTDELINKAYALSDRPNRRELDMLLSTGERVSMALFSIALTDALQELQPQAKAISFTGSQAGILTDETHSNARIIDVKPTRVQHELQQGNVVILAGFQGVSPQTKEITTLGRGGSDVTAIAMAAAFQAKRCEILKEVDGVLTADPKIVPNARLIPKLEHKHLLDMTFWGAKVLHYRSVELAAARNVPLFVGLAHGHSGERGTHIETSESGGGAMSHFETDAILAINSHADVREVTMTGSIDEVLASIAKALAAKQLPMPQILDASFQNSETKLLITSPAESLEAQAQVLRIEKSTRIESAPVSTVTVTCQGTYTTELIGRLSALLAKSGVKPRRVLTHALGMTFVVPQSQRNESVMRLHQLSTVP